MTFPYRLQDAHSENRRLQPPFSTSPVRYDPVPTAPDGTCCGYQCIAPGCNTHFCYRCGETINRTAIPREIQEGKTAHFRNCPIVG